MPPYALEADRCAQCARCHMWCSPADLGLEVPGVCGFCDLLREQWEAYDGLRGLLVGDPWLDGPVAAAMRALLDEVGRAVRAMRAAGPPPKNISPQGENGLDKAAKT